LLEPAAQAGKSYSLIERAAIEFSTGSFTADILKLAAACVGGSIARRWQGEQKITLNAAECGLETRRR
jgi:hypothetical protein